LPEPAPIAVPPAPLPTTRWKPKKKRWPEAIRTRIES
jgi:hypothetical protein